MTQLHFPGFLPPVPPAPVVPPSRSPFAAQIALAAYPRVPGTIRASFGKNIGRAGEEFVASILSRFGFENFPAPEDQPFDRLVRFTPDGGASTSDARIQIKTATAHQNRSYTFSMQRGYRGSPQGRQSYGDDAYDIAALVILPRNAVFFTAEKATQHRIHLSEVPGLINQPQRSLFTALGLPHPASPDADDADDAPGHAPV